MSDTDQPDLDFDQLMLREAWATKDRQLINMIEHDLSPMVSWLRGSGGPERLDELLELWNGCIQRANEKIAQQIKRRAA